MLLSRQPSDNQLPQITVQHISLAREGKKPHTFWGLPTGDPRLRLMPRFIESQQTSLFTAFDGLILFWDHGTSVVVKTQLILQQVLVTPILEGLRRVGLHVVMGGIAFH